MLFCFLVVSAQCKIYFGLNKFNGIPLLEFLSGNQTFSSKAGHLRMCDVLEILGHILGIDGGRIDVLYYNRIFNPF